MITLLNQIIYYHGSNQLRDKFNKMIYSYKLDAPVLMIENCNNHINIFEITIESFVENKCGYKNERVCYINLWINSIKSDTIDDMYNDLKEISKYNFTTKYSRCLYCFKSNSSSENSLCRKCANQILILKYGSIKSTYPVILSYHKIQKGFRTLNFSWYTIDNNSLTVWYKYNTGNERVIFKLLKPLPEFQVELYHEYIYQSTFEFKCAICNDYYEGDESEYDSDDNNEDNDINRTICNGCQNIVLQKLGLKLVPVIMLLYKIEDLNYDSQSYIKKLLI